MTCDAITADAQITSDGFVHVDALLGRHGTFDYLASELKWQWPDCKAIQSLPDDAIVKAYRAPSEIGAQETLDSLAFMPVTNDHPHDMLNPGNVGGYIVGTTKGGVSLDQGRPRAGVVLYRSDAIKAYQAGKVELSLGCWNDFVWAPGVTADGEPYDMEIKNIRGNHVALVDRGRAGRDVRILDSAEKLNSGGKTMKVTIGGVSYDIDDSAAQLLAKERADHQATLDRMEGEMASLKDKVLNPEDIDKLVSERAKAEARSQEVAKMRQACKDAGIDVDNKSDEFVEGRYAGLSTEPKPHVTHDEVGIGRPAAPGPVDIAAFKRRMYQ